VKFQHTLYWGDARHMEDLADESVHLVVTSPPYWQLKDYGVKRQIGYNDSYEEYVAGLNQVWAECLRVLHPGCRLCVNIGDQFARAAHYGRYKVIPLHEAVIHGCEVLGFDYMGAIIWQKATTMNASGGGSVMGSFPHPRNGIVKLDYEFILLFKKLGTAPKVSKERKEKAAMTTAEWNEYFNGHWRFPGEKQGGAPSGSGHIAMFPIELPRRLIKMFSFPGETVLDPFAGSGTTLRAAHEMGRLGVGYEINGAFEDAIRKRVRAARLLEFRVSCARPVSRKKRLVALTKGNYLTRKADAKLHSCGSIISLEDVNKPREKGVRVREILAPTRLRLADGAIVHLLGVRPVPGKENDAVSYLKTKLLGRAVFLKDSTRRGTAQRAYVYMENKTFINAKLIQQGLAEADPKAQHRYAAKFNAQSVGINKRQ
jgi:modification methylase